MSYDIAVWEGERPASDAHALETFNALMDAVEENADLEPTPRIRSFIKDLIAQWDEGDEPWSVTPLTEDEGIGPIVYLAVTFDSIDEVQVIADIAKRHHLICFDPQAETLIPQS
jgi:hypothetical protein